MYLVPRRVDFDHLLSVKVEDIIKSGNFFLSTPNRLKLRIRLIFSCHSIPEPYDSSVAHPSVQHLRISCTSPDREIADHALLD